MHSKNLCVAHYVGSVEAFWALLAFKFDGIALIEGLIAVFLNCRKVNKYIFAGRTLNKAVPLGTVKPLHNTLFPHG